MVSVKHKVKYLILGLVILGIGLSLKNNLVGGWDKESFSKRWNLNVAAVEMVKESMWIGKGAGNFISELPLYQKDNNWLQPVHNILLLLVSETGILGLGILILNLVNFYKRKVWSKMDKILIGIILISGMWDHYWLTLPQNWWLLTIVMGII